jgi:outer membrane lipoprotein carrier protein
VSPREVQRKPRRVRHSYVTRFVLLAVLALPALAADSSLDPLLDAVEHRYNSITSLQVSFEETFTAAGRGRRAESGELFLRKPGRMRWVYSQPAGKLFVSDGKSLFYYNPITKQAEKLKLNESEDLRAPLAFLLGKLDFQKDFQGLRSRSDPNGTVITAQPKSDKLPYSQVEFLVGPQNEIRSLVITG